MTPAVVKALVAQTSVTDVPAAGRAVGFSRARAYERVVRGEFPCAVLKVGQRYVVPTAGILAALGLDE